jgi:hypothetical protein
MNKRHANRKTAQALSNLSATVCFPFYATREGKGALPSVRAVPVRSSNTRRMK